MEFRLVRILEASNNVDFTKKANFKEPEYFYKTLFNPVPGPGPSWGQLEIVFSYLPLLEVGSVYSLSELENM